MRKQFMTGLVALAIAAAGFVAAPKIVKQASQDGSLLTIESGTYDNGLVFLSNQELLANFGGLRQFKIQNGKLLGEQPFKTTHFTPFSPSSFESLSPSGRFLAAEMGIRGRHRPDAVWDVQTGSLLRRLQQGPAGFFPLKVFSPDETIVAASGSVALSDAEELKARGTGMDIIRTGGVKVWDRASGKLLWFADERAEGDFETYRHPIAFSPDVKVLAEAFVFERGSRKSGIRLRNARTGRLIRELAIKVETPPYGPYDSSGWHLITFSPDGASIATVGGDKSSYSANGHDGAIYVWDVQTGRLKWKGWKRDVTPQAIAFSPDGSLIACGCNVWNRSGPAGGEVTLWDAKSGKLLRSLTRETVSDRIVHGWASKVEMIKQILPNSKRSGRLPSDKSYPVEAVAFSPDGKLLATGDRRVIKIWDVEKYRP
jgi:WD40 repeat protein